MKTCTSTFALTLVLSSVLAAASGATIAASPKLKGDYAVAGDTFCLTSTTVRLGVPVSPSGFDPDTLQPRPGASIVNAQFSLHGVATFDGQGSGTIKGRFVLISFAPGAPGSFSANTAHADVVGSFTFEVAPDGTVTTTSEAFNATVLSGPRTGQTNTNSGFSLKGRASHNRHSIALATDEPQIETVAFSNGDVQERVCHRSQSLIRTDD
jgi:hypothetical protein